MVREEDVAAAQDSPKRRAPSPSTRWLNTEKEDRIMARTPSAPVTWTQDEIDLISQKPVLSLTASDRAKLAKYQRDQEATTNAPLDAAHGLVIAAAIQNRLAVRDFILGEIALSDARAALEAEVISQGLTKTLPVGKVGKGYRHEAVVVPAIPIKRTSFGDAMGIIEQILEDSSNPGHVLPALVGRQLNVSVFESCIAAQTPVSAINLLVRAGVLKAERATDAERGSGKYTVTGYLATRAEMEKLVERQSKAEKAEVAAAPVAEVVASEGGTASNEAASTSSETPATPTASTPASGKGSGRGGKRNAA